VTVPYEPSFRRFESHFSNLYFGCSLGALSHLAQSKGYALVGSNSAGNNAYFVRRDRLGGLVEMSVKDAYVVSNFRESRDRAGNLNYVSGSDRRKALAALPLHDVYSGKMISVGDLHD
jgi:hypothetical protein